MTTTTIEAAAATTTTIEADKGNSHGGRDRGVFGTTVITTPMKKMLEGPFIS